MAKDQKVCVVCPGGSVTGGPELLHQLVSKLTEYGIQAGIMYFPFEKHYKTPDQYEKYNCKVYSPLAAEGAIMILPETATRLARRFPSQNVIIWWLSVDNYLGLRGDNAVKDGLRYLRSLLFNQEFSRTLKQYRHLVQSNYAKNYLTRRGLISAPLGDFLSEEHISSLSSSNVERRNQIVFNPRKGLGRTLRLMRALPQFPFIPIQGLNSRQVAELLSDSKIYVDLGNHPGRDRLPREAALAGCCVIVGRHGASGNDIDIPIPDVYKIDDRRNEFEISFSSIATSIMHDYNLHSKRFEDYRRQIRLGEALFDEQLQVLVKELRGAGA